MALGICAHLGSVVLLSDREQITVFFLAVSLPSNRLILETFYLCQTSHHIGLGFITVCLSKICRGQSDTRTGFPSVTDPIQCQKLRVWLQKYFKKVCYRSRYFTAHGQNVFHVYLYHLKLTCTHPAYLETAPSRCNQKTCLTRRRLIIVHSHLWYFNTPDVVFQYCGT